jgi:hypothetical protein
LGNFLLGVFAGPDLIHDLVRVVGTVVFMLMIFIVVLVFRIGMVVRMLMIFIVFLGLNSVRGHAMLSLGVD